MLSLENKPCFEISFRSVVPKDVYVVASSAGVGRSYIAVNAGVREGAGEPRELPAEGVSPKDPERRRGRPAPRVAPENPPEEPQGLWQGFCVRPLVHFPLFFSLF